MTILRSLGESAPRSQETQFDGGRMNRYYGLLIGCLLLTGCASFRDAIVQDQLYLRNAGEARLALQEFEQLASVPSEHPDHFRGGFKDGYIAVAMGATGCPPTLPPKKYWHAKYRTAEGKLVVTAWYNGYAEGATAAESTGAADRNRVHTALDIYGAGNSRLSASNYQSNPTPTDASEPIPMFPDVVLPPAPGVDGESPPPSASEANPPTGGFGMSLP